MTNYAMPTHLTGQMADLWNQLREMAADKPDKPVKVTDSALLPQVEALAAVGGCTFEKVDGGMNVTLLFAPDESADETPEVTAVAKPHKFANEDEA